LTTECGVHAWAGPRHKADLRANNLFIPSLIKINHRELSSNKINAARESHPRSETPEPLLKMEKHEHQYGCTFLTCDKSFDSKNDWKRHENSQHFHLESWRCDEERAEGGACAKICYRKGTFQDHLAKVHKLVDLEKLRFKIDNCRIGRNCQTRFWCGFCLKLVALRKRGVDAWTERFDHIDDHFLGRHGLPKQGIQDWVPVDGDRPKRQIESPHSLEFLDEDHEAFGSAP
jgi:hypothetical protein